MFSPVPQKRSIGQTYDDILFSSHDCLGSVGNLFIFALKILKLTREFCIIEMFLIYRNIYHAHIPLSITNWKTQTLG
jgi:hypothetical protein